MAGHQSIHPDYLSADAAKDIIRLEVPVDLSEGTLVTVEDDLAANGASSNASGSDDVKVISLKTLPPILLDICLPPTYPYTPPQIRAVHSAHSWFTCAGRDLHEHLAEKWEKGEGVLYTWVEWIRSGDFLDELGMTSMENGQRVIWCVLLSHSRLVLPDCHCSIAHPTPGVVLPALEAYNRNTETARFSQNSFECEVCLTSIKGARCIRLSCSHVFCRSCLEDFWKLCIKEGEVGRVGCPDPGCTREQREAEEEEVRRVVTEDELMRWKWLRMKRAVEKGECHTRMPVKHVLQDNTDPTLVHCPMCQTAVPRQPGVEDGSSWERLRTCSGCSYSFCAYCKRTWCVGHNCMTGSINLETDLFSQRHGPVSSCPISATKAILHEYMAFADGSTEKKLMEMRYGRSALRKLVVEYEQEKAFQEWLDRSTGTPCPGCDLRVEKHSGCNHVRRRAVGLSLSAVARL